MKFLHALCFILLICSAIDARSNKVGGGEGQLHNNKDQSDFTANSHDQEEPYESSDDDIKTTTTRSQQQQSIVDDERTVQEILSASSLGQHYEVLGILLPKNKNKKVPAWRKVFLGPITYFDSFTTQQQQRNMRISPLDVKKAYRKMAKLVHPDKNKSESAQEAFEALERSMHVLSGDYGDGDTLAENEDNNWEREERDRRRGHRRNMFSVFVVSSWLGPLPSILPALVLIAWRPFRR
eukprot:CAMPEP_0195525358 /NCGR_PEP_ID=MMETSP0794_2-20130614/25783_1 /TAXON_ID=515487 /ORGANISM="Stephanopyxis turris, Strain CCMP 815" /LENGTH=237 /DNA_ID=CAMNT_0040655811 /DNA_START=116 /DNA_END=829 /DNA_ORIENTATION=-